MSKQQKTLHFVVSDEILELLGAVSEPVIEDLSAVTVGRVTRSDVIRLALLTGLRTLHGRFVGSSPKSPKSAAGGR